MKKPHWTSYKLDREDFTLVGTTIARFLNTDDAFKDYEILDVNVIQVGVSFVEILVRERALT